MGSRRRAIAIFISLAIHGVLMLVLVRSQKRPLELTAAEEGRVSIDIDVSSTSQPAQSTPSQAASEQPPAPPLKAGSRAAQRDRSSRGTKAASAQNEPGKSQDARAEARSASPGEGDDVPRRAELTPGLAALQASAGSGGSSVSEAPSEVVDSVTSEEVRVKSRLDGMLGEEIAHQRVEKGLVDRYFGELKHAFEHEMRDPPKFDTHAVRGYLNNWSRLARAYAKNENPYDSDTARSAGGGQLPATRFSGGVTTRIDQAQASLESAQAFRKSLESSGTAIVAVVELLQKPDGKLNAITLIESSGHRSFDQYVLKIAPTALDKLPSPPVKGAGIHPQGLRSTWAFVAKAVYRKKLRDINLAKDWWYYAIAAPLGLAGGSFDETSGQVWVSDLRDPKFECDARLLAVY
jgi:hypothetical protein